MNRKTKILTVVLLAVCLMFQLVVASGAATVTEAEYNKTLPNWQEKIVLLDGKNDSKHTKKAEISFTGGTANYIYVQVQLTSGSAVSSGWTKLSRSTDFYNIAYASTIGSGTAMQVVGYQKNVEAKTASGYIFL